MCRHPSLDAGNRTVTGDKRSTRSLIAGVAVALLSLLAPAAALATFPPGDNGVIGHVSAPGGPEPPFRQYGLWTITADGTKAVQIPGGTGARYPSFSPDGDRVVFVRHVDQTVQRKLFVMSSSGGTATELTPGRTGDELDPAFAPNGADIVFTYYPGNGTSDLYILHPGSAPVNVTNTPGVNESSPDYSPDGTKLIYTRRAGAQSGIGVLDLTTGDLDGLTTPGLSIFSEPVDREPAFSPDGDQIVFVRDNDPDANAGESLWRMNADGSGQVKLVGISGRPASETQPSYSPDGRFVIWFGPKPGDTTNQDFDLFIANADGSAAHGIVPESTVGDTYPAWQRLPEGTLDDDEGDGAVLGQVSGGRCAGARTTITGSDRADRIRGTRGNDVIATGRGSDVVFGRGGRDVICGDGGRDSLLGNGGRDTLLGGRGADTLWGGPRRDALFGGAGVDRLIGGGGLDFYGAGSNRDSVFP